MMTTKQHQRPAIWQNGFFTLFGAVFFFAFSSCNAARTTTAHHQHDSSEVSFWVPQQHEPTDLHALYRSLLLLRGASGQRQQPRASRLLDYYSSCNYVWDETSNGYICQTNNNNTEPLRIVIPSLLVGTAILITCCRCFYLHRQQQDAWAQRQHQLVLAHQHQRQRTSNDSNNNASHHLNKTEPRLVTAATIGQRSSPNARAGIGFVGNDYAKITRIQHDSILHGSELVPGMKVVSINNISIGSARQAAEVIATVMVLKDVLTILAHSPGYYGSTENYVTATAVKERPDQPLGITYKREFSHGPIRLGTISETSLLLQSSQHGTASTGGTDLMPGMEVVAVNNIPVQSLAQATEITRSAFPLVTILARRSAAVVVAMMESRELNVPIVARPISQSYAIGDEPLAVAVATVTTATTTMIEEDRGSSIEI